MKNNALIIALFTLICLTACETSKTYFGDTATTIEGDQHYFRLDLSNQALTTLPVALAQQTELRTLNLSKNPALNLPHALDIICTLPNLHVLILNDLQLRTLPANIKKCTALTQVSLANNIKLNFEQALSALSGLKLEFLDLSNNQLSALPTSLGTMKTLRDLRLSHNRIHRADAYKTIAQLPRLFSLWLDNNQLTLLPDEIGLLASVGYLYLDNNYLTGLPQSMRFMRRLSAAWLGHNCFEQVPTTLADRGIFMAFLNNNRITDIGDRFRTSPFFVRGIILDYNYLSHEQRKEASKIFHDTFIYSDQNQFEKSQLTPCGASNFSHQA
jgi:Leucine-rich repeat (LRR) protein